MTPLRRKSEPFRRAFASAGELGSVLRGVVIRPLSALLRIRPTCRAAARRLIQMIEITYIFNFMPISAFAEIGGTSEKCLDAIHQKHEFQQMLKQAKSVKDLERRAADFLRELLEEVPAIELQRIEHAPPGQDRGIDLLVHLNTGGRPRMLVCEFKASGQPRHVRAGILQLRDYVSRNRPDAEPVLIAPYLSPEAQSLCRKHDVGFLDFEGNCRLSFDGVFIERRVATKPATERRELRSIFKPKSAQVLRVLMRDLQRPWRVTELAEAADVSLGHASNVRTALLDKEWATVGPDGLSLTEPDALLDAWRVAYEPPAGRRLGFYSTLHGSAFEAAARTALGAANKRGAAMLASFSAARWLAPFARTGTEFFYADEFGLDVLRSELKLSSAAKGENVVVTQPRDHGLFRDNVEPAPGIVCTSPVQTYLDLSLAGERGREAADHLRGEKLTWHR